MLAAAALSLVLVGATAEPSSSPPGWRFSAGVAPTLIFFHVGEDGPDAFGSDAFVLPLNLSLSARNQNFRYEAGVGFGLFTDLFAGVAYHLCVGSLDPYFILEVGRLAEDIDDARRTDHYAWATLGAGLEWSGSTFFGRFELSAGLQRQEENSTNEAVIRFSPWLGMKF